MDQKKHAQQGAGLTLANKLSPLAGESDLGGWPRLSDKLRNAPHDDGVIDIGGRTFRFRETGNAIVLDPVQKLTAPTVDLAARQRDLDRLAVMTRQPIAASL
jgi:hypothetical protein